MNIKKILAYILVCLVLCLSFYNVIPTPIIAAGALINVNDTLSDNYTGHASNHTITFTTSTAIPKNGKIVIMFPAGFNLAGVRLGANVDPYSLSFSGQTVTLNKIGNLPVAAGTMLSISLENIVNPPTAGNAYFVTVTTTLPTGGYIDGPSSSSPFALISPVAKGLVMSGYPSTTDTGVAHSFTVIADDGAGHAAAGYAGTIHFTSSDPGAVLPSDYTYSPGDAGVHSFSAILNTPGIHQIIATDTQDSSINGSQGNILVNLPEGVSTVTTLTSSQSTAIYGDPVTFTASVSAISGTPAGSVIFKDGVNELGTSTLTGGQATYSASRQQLGVGTHNITAAYGGNANYKISTSTSLTQIITARTLKVSATGIEKTYDGNATASVSLTSDQIAGDNVVLTFGTASFLDKNAGENKSISVSGISVSGLEASNYSWNSTTDATANIFRRELNITAQGINKIYNGTTTAVVTLLDDRVAGDSLTISYSAADFSDKNAGTQKTVTVSGIAVNGVDAGNYNWNTTAFTKADINRATPKITWATPSDISYPAPLGSIQLNATATITGQFAYSPASGTILDIGNKQTLRVSFTPQDSVNYNSASASVMISVIGSGLKIVFTNVPQQILPEAISGLISMQIQDSSGKPAKFVADTVIQLSTSSATGKFDKVASGAFDGSVSTVTVNAGTSSAGFYYKDASSGTPVITVSGTGLAGASQLITIKSTTAGGGVIPPGGGTSGGVIDVTTQPPINPVVINGFVMDGTLAVDSTGKVQSDVQLKTNDNRVTLDIKLGITLLNIDNKPLSEFSAVRSQDFAISPPGRLLLAYDFKPDGAHFDSPLVLKMKYDQNDLGEIQEATLRIVGWNGSEWMPLESVLDTVSRTVTVNVSHFSLYAMVGNSAAVSPTSSVPVSPSKTNPVVTSSPETPKTAVPATTAPGTIAGSLIPPETNPGQTPTEGATGLPQFILILIYVSIFLVVTLLSVIFFIRHSRSVN